MCAMPVLHRNARLVIRIAEPLREQLEAAAREDGESVSSLVRQVLISFAGRRLVARERRAA
jgi:hypothetical protein